MMTRTCTAHVRVPMNSTGKRGSVHHGRKTSNWILDKHCVKMPSGLKCLIVCHAVGPFEHYDDSWPS